MYEAHFGLNSRPFALQPDPAFLYWSDQHRRAAQVLAQGGGAGDQGAGDILVLTGPVGAGKTTLIMNFVQSPPSDTVVALVRNIPPHVTYALPWVAAAFGLPTEAAGDDLPARISAWLADQRRAGKRAVLIVDEAQNVQAEALAALAMLLDANGADTRPEGPALLLALVGQPELQTILKQPENAAIAARIGTRIQLGRMRPEETRAYISHRLHRAGADRPIFTDDALELIHRAANGVPRMVNLIADQLLVGAFADGLQQLDTDAAADIIAKSQAPALLAVPIKVIRNQLRDDHRPDANPAPPITRQDPTVRQPLSPPPLAPAPADAQTDPAPTAEAPQRQIIPVRRSDDRMAATQPKPPATARLMGHRMVLATIGLALFLALALLLFGGKPPASEEQAASAPVSPATPAPQQVASPEPAPAQDTADEGAARPPQRPASSDSSPAELARDAPAQLEAALDLAAVSPEAAAIVLARAAVAGSDMAALRLGTLYGTGDGVPLDPALAAAWYRRAARNLPEAKERLERLGPAPLARPLAPPDPLLADPRGGRADLVWQGSGSARTYHVDIGDDQGNVLASRSVGVPSVSFLLPDGAALWRVTALGVDGNRLSSDWLRLPLE